MNRNRRRILLFYIYIFIPISSLSQSVIHTVHNLSYSGPGLSKSSSESEVCIFCHTPHSSEPLTPLWNKETGGSFYILYNNSTLQANPGQPDGSSLLCLSCHDGTIALGNLISRPGTLDFSEGWAAFKRSGSNLSTDLSDDHIISIEYSSALTFIDRELKHPNVPAYFGMIENGKVQCTSCHDAHNNMNGKFLIRTDQFSELCLSCHDKPYWDASTHNSSSIRIGNVLNKSVKAFKYETVSENGCSNCHVSHSAGGKKNLLRERNEENNCILCHNGTVSEKNIFEQINKPYGHRVYSYDQIHEKGEDPRIMKMHVECTDCHNPHAGGKFYAKAPYIKGVNFGTQGIQQSGLLAESVQYEYELCYRCHSDNPNKPHGSIRRQIEQNNVRMEFENSNPSFHPVSSIGVNPNVPSLIPPLTESSIIYCTDCHSGNGEQSTKGPHGSIYPHILKYNYSRGERIKESYFAYELCYKCHDRNMLIGEFTNGSQKSIHYLHIREEDTPCSVCHDAHGISGTQGNKVNNSHLINFDISVVKPVNGILRFEDTGMYSGSCTLNCHGKIHQTISY